ncbi:MAG: S41 family peptidase [Planctomycetota bacterium]|jgi:carboxyl-terminal processing protease
MQQVRQSVVGMLQVALAAMLVLGSGMAVRADHAPEHRDTQVSAAQTDKLWTQTVDDVTHGRFDEASESMQKISDRGPFAGDVLRWLNDFEKQQSERRALDKADFEKYEGYAKERIERGEFTLGLDWAIRCWDVAADQDAFLKTGWLLDLTEKALVKAEELRKEEDWLAAWRIYSDLGILFEREPRYKKLEREAQTHYRLNVLFEKDNYWGERIEKVRWEDARAALDDIGLHYVKPADFKSMCEVGLEQLLILARSKSAQEAFDGLGDEDNRDEFITRVEAKLNQVREAATVDRRTCIEHFRRVISKINKQTVQLPEQLIVSELMRGALEPLDDYTTIIWPSDADEFRKQTDGEFVGVGISIVKNRVTDEIEVVTPLEDSPAYRAGIQAGDVITLVDGDSLEGFSLNKVVKTITGKRSTMVTLTIRRGEAEIEFPLKRERIKIASVKGLKRNEDNPNQWEHWIDKDMGVGYIRLTNFQKNTAEDVENVLSRLEAGGLKALILDLRGNPGGLLDSAWRISTLFLEAGETVVSTKGRHRSENQSFYAPGDGPYSDIPVTVLTDENSASASEIVAGAIRDNNGGLVVGARTFGKFSVQNLMSLGASQAKLKITTAHYYLPSGVSLHKDPQAKEWGVEPNIPVRLVSKEKSNLYRMRRENDLLGPARPTADPDEKADDKKDDKDAAADAKNGDESGKDKAKDAEPDKDAVADADDEKKEDKLPPLDQPDENNRPKNDPQLDTALLVTKIKLLAERFPSLASAEKQTTKEVARP